MDITINTQLVQGLKSGSYSDFDKLYTIYADLLYWFVFNLTKSPSDAEDIVQETFLRVWQARERLSPDMSLKSYLYTIARNLIINSFRNKIESVAFEAYITSEAYQNHADNNIEQLINFDEFQMRLTAAKEKLTKNQKKIFELSREKQYSISLISKQLNLSEKTIKNQLSLALKVLRSELDYYYLFLLFFLWA